MRRLLYAAYSTGLTILFLLGWPYIAWRLWKRGHVWKNLGERFACYPPEKRRKLAGGTDLWIHAVSVGEVMIAEALLRHLRALRPSLRAVVTTTTATGYRLATRLADEQTVSVYNPFDFPWTVRRALNAFAPRMLVLVEAELWPNCIRHAADRKIPIYLVNARLSSRSQARYERCRKLARQMLESLSLVLVQDPTDYPRFTRAGFPPERLFCPGSLKYDVAELPAAHAAALEADWPRTGWRAEDPVLLAASTHPGEEALFLDRFPEWKKRHPNLRLVLAPRHAERARAIRALARERKLAAGLRSELPAQQNDLSSILIFDTTGELKALYPKATVVFVGKTLSARGGQNFIEAAREGAAVVVGPHTQNFQQLAEHFVREKGLLQIPDEAALSEAITTLLSQPDRRRALGDRARAIFAQNRGAAERTARILLDALSAQAP